MNYASILIITYGRSGSTLLQGLLNSIPGCSLHGENYNFCYGLFKSYQALLKTRKEFGHGEYSTLPTSPWYGAAWMDEDTFIQDARKLVLNQLDPQHASTCVGFKEIRYTELTGRNELADFLGFLGMLFPNPAFIFLTRDHDQVAESAWWKLKEPEQVKRILSKFEAQLLQYKEGKTNIFPISYSDMIQRSETLKDMFHFLGAEYIEAKVAQVLSIEHSYHEKDSNAPPPAKWHRYVTECANNRKAIEFLRLDPITTQVEDPEPVTVNGVVVLSETVKSRQKLVLVDSQGEHPVKWGMPSPVIASELLHNPNSARARFSVDNISITAEKPAVIFLENNKGVRKWIFRISLSEKTPDTEVQHKQA